MILDKEPVFSISLPLFLCVGRQELECRELSDSSQFAAHSNSWFVQGTSLVLLVHSLIYFFVSLPSTPITPSPTLINTFEFVCSFVKYVVLFHVNVI